DRAPRAVKGAQVGQGEGGVQVDRGVRGADRAAVAEAAGQAQRAAADADGVTVAPGAVQGEAGPVLRLDGAAVADAADEEVCRRDVDRDRVLVDQGGIGVAEAAVAALYADARAQGQGLAARGAQEVAAAAAEDHAGAAAQGLRAVEADPAEGAAAVV